jgi:hypothetical protein
MARGGVAGEYDELGYTAVQGLGRYLCVKESYKAVRK